MSITVATLALSPLATMGPRHTHDCECCKFLGRVDVDGDDPKDVWVHGAEENGEDTLILRFDSPGPAYLSFAVFIARRASMEKSGLSWKLGLLAYDAWVEAGRPR
jgi:hypothetical protein